jgi:hypothetical protein
MNGNVTLGNASADDVTVTGSLASSIPIKTTYSYDIGAATLGLRKLYLGSDDSGAFSTFLEAGTNSASYGLKLPDADGAALDYVQTDGSGQLAFVGGPTITSKTTTYTATTADKVITVTTGSSWTLTLYAASGNSGRTLRIYKTSSDTNILTITGNGSETISGYDNIYLVGQYEWVDLICNGSNWILLNFGPQYVGSAEGQETSGTAGGASSANTVQTRTINTAVGDLSKFASISSNQVTVGPGQYEVGGMAPAYKVNRHQAFLYDVTGTAYVADGVAAYNGSGDDDQGLATFQTKLRVTAANAYELRHWTSGAQAANGLGVNSDNHSSNPQSNEVYGKLVFRRVGP